MSENDTAETRWRRNNLDQTASPYLQQHRDNPVWWQPWTEDTLARAQEKQLPLFVSVGYATCHWCHVMAAEAFSDTEVAAVLNTSFMCIKVDREERPDIDHFLMQYLLATRGHGGWPLNAFLTPDLKPMLALTYVPVQPSSGMPGFVTILEKVADFFQGEGGKLPSFDLWEGVPKPGEQTLSSAPWEEAAHRGDNLLRRMDRQYGGFGQDTKFPPHSSLLYLLYLLSTQPPGSERAVALERGIRLTLNAMARGGLHDHLQGGFFRYCVDRQWTIPHFEKMLYDQAMLLWVYSLASRVLQDEWYQEVALGIYTALEETFRDERGLYISAHDADTEHQEGLTYVWDAQELPENLRDVFILHQNGNFEGRTHLIRRDGGVLPADITATLNTLLELRKERPQPASDDKIVTAWNGLAGIALIHAGRFLQRPDLTARGTELFDRLWEQNGLPDQRLLRSTLPGKDPESVECLEDYGAMLVYTTMLMEETEDPAEISRLRSIAAGLRTNLDRFKDERGWRYSIAGDMPSIPADTFDNPSPSPVSLAEAGLVRLGLLDGEVSVPVPFEDDSHRDFHNIVAMMAQGEFFVLEQPALLPWDELPPQTLQICATGSTICFARMCRPGTFNRQMWQQYLERQQPG
jgi:uncharacterized protein YyaL (SSP411 family)